MGKTSENGSITEALLDNSAEIYENGIARKTADSIIKNGINNTACSHEAVISMSHMFSDEIDPMDITDQKKSGRCWIFAGMNLLRYRIHENLQIKNPDFELSQTYIMFYDKFEKSNYFLESVIDTAKEPKNSRIVMWLFANLLQDGGQWDMLVNIIQKYGILPKYAMPETFHSSNSADMNSILCKKLRKDGIILRRMAEEGKSIDEMRAEKEKMLAEIYGMLCCFLGKPPKTFNFEYRDRDNKFHRNSAITPLKFFDKYIGDGFIDSYVSIINAPTDDKPYDNTYTVKYLGNVVGGKPVVYLNLGSEALEQAACRQIKDGEPVWFGSDVGKMYNRELGIMDTNLYRYEDVLNMDLHMSKADMLDYGQSCLTHAMMLLGVDIENGGIKKWKVENSWGKDVGEKGFFVMSNDWFKEYVCQVIINKKYLSKEQLSALEKEPLELEPWDPIGSLA
jgi:bleomycin hydrolase